MNVTNATFGPAFEGAGAEWELQVQVEGSKFEFRAASVIAQVGNVPVERIVLKLEGDGFIGLLRKQPNAGDKLQVGYLDMGLMETDIEFQPLVG